MYGGWKLPGLLCHLGRSFNVVVQVPRGGGRAGIFVRGQWQTTFSPRRPSQHTHSLQETGRDSRERVLLTRDSSSRETPPCKRLLLARYYSLQETPLLTRDSSLQETPPRKRLLLVRDSSYHETPPHKRLSSQETPPCERLLLTIGGPAQKNSFFLNGPKIISE